MTPRAMTFVLFALILAPVMLIGVARLSTPEESPRLSEGAPQEPVAYASGPTCDPADALAMHDGEPVCPLPLPEPDEIPALTFDTITVQAPEPAPRVVVITKQVPVREVVYVPTPAPAPPAPTIDLSGWTSTPATPWHTPATKALEKAKAQPKPAPWYKGLDKAQPKPAPWW